MDRNTGGTVVGIALGTAIVPFLDIVAYILRMNVYNQSLSEKKIKLFGDETFEWLANPTFKFVLFVSIRNAEEGLCIKLCQKLKEFNTAKGLDNFDLFIRDSSTGQSRWDRAYFASKIDPNRVTKAYIASVAGTEAAFSKQLTEIGIPKDRITIL